MFGEIKILVKLTQTTYSEIKLLFLHFIINSEY